MKINVAIFNSSNEPIKLMRSPIRHVINNIPVGGTWREVPDYVHFLQDVPLLETLPIYPDRVIDDVEISDNLFPDEILTEMDGSIEISVDVGTIVTTTDGIQYTENAGIITVIFSQEGFQYLSIKQLNKAPCSKQVKVMFFDSYLSMLKQMIDTQRDIRLLQNITFDGIELDGDAASQKNIAEAATLGAFEALKGNISWSMNWITANNNIVTLNAIQLEGFANVIAARRETQYGISRATKNDIAAATNKTSADTLLNNYLTS